MGCRYGNKVLFSVDGHPSEFFSDGSGESFMDTLSADFDKYADSMGGRLDAALKEAEVCGEVVDAKEGPVWR